MAADCEIKFSNLMHLQKAFSFMFAILNLIILLLLLLLLPGEAIPLPLCQ